MIGRLGLRYHPTNQTDLGAHQAMLAMLAQDVAHIPPEALEKAIDRHVLTSPYMPKAADLIKLVVEDAARRPAGISRSERPYVYDLCDAYNAKRTRADVVWIVTDAGELKLTDAPEAEARRTAHLARTAEDERQRMVHRKPITGAGDD